ncbi:MAG: hypothetical protein IJ323_01915 [Clostridia bacterium]|nr:hypothetical protein [Clostridia bacterium]
MMNEPSIEKLTKDGLNRYQVCIATAKIAREIINEYNEEANRIAAASDTLNVKRPVHDDKPVKTAVHAIDRGDYKVIPADHKGEEVLYGKE